MSQQERRRRLKRLGETPDLAWYMATPESIVRKHLPPQLRPRFREGPCSGCGTALLYDANGWERGFRLAVATGKQLTLVCRDCCEAMIRRRQEPTVAVALQDDDLEAQFARHQAEKN
jgi:hypothetical protein